MTGGAASFLRKREDGIALRVRLQPGAAKDAIGAAVILADGSKVLAMRVRAIAEKGRANEALCRLTAGSLGVAAGRVRVVSGFRDRIKTLHIEGDAEKLAATARALAAPVSD